MNGKQTIVGEMLSGFAQCKMPFLFLEAQRQMGNTCLTANLLTSQHTLYIAAVYKPPYNLNVYRVS